MDSCLDRETEGKVGRRIFTVKGFGQAHVEETPYWWLLICSIKERVRLSAESGEET